MSHVDKLKNLVYSQKRTVSIRDVCYSLNVHVSEARRIFDDFLDEEMEVDPSPASPPSSSEEKIISEDEKPRGKEDNSEDEAIFMEEVKEKFKKEKSKKRKRVRIYDSDEDEDEEAMALRILAGEDGDNSNHSSVAGSSIESSKSEEPEEVKPVKKLRKKSKPMETKTISEEFVDDESYTQVRVVKKLVPVEENVEESIENGNDNSNHSSVAGSSIESSKSEESEEVKPRDFFFNEAEVSGSDNSDDEEEEEEDEILKELIDEKADALDLEDLRKDVASSYHKELLKDDQRLLLQLQERYLEDGDLHSDQKRAKKFKWKTSDSPWLDDARNSSSDDEDDEDDGAENMPVFKLKSKPVDRIADSCIDVNLPSISTTISTNKPKTIKDYLFTDKHLVDILSTKSNVNKRVLGLKRIKPGSSKSLFDLLK